MILIKAWLAALSLLLVWFMTVMLVNAWYSGRGDAAPLPKEVGANGGVVGLLAR